MGNRFWTGIFLVMAILPVLFLLDSYIDLMYIVGATWTITFYVGTALYTVGMMGMGYMATKRKTE